MSAPAVEHRPIKRGTPLVAYWFPFPPSVNNLFFNRGRGRAPTKRYQEWKSEAAVALFQQGKRSFAGSTAFHVSVTPPDARRRDLDNLLKAPLDFCVQQGVIQDDSLIRRIGIEWADPPAENPGVVIEITEAG